MNIAVLQSKTRGNATENMHAVTALLSADAITGEEVCNLQDEKLGKIQDVMLDACEGKVRYAVLSSGGFLGMDDRLFAVPWKVLKQDKLNKRFILDVDVERIKNAPGFDKDEWPNMADISWNSSIESYYAK